MTAGRASTVAAYSAPQYQDETRSVEAHEKSRMPGL
jgi:hypothetical protein